MLYIQPLCGVIWLVAPVSGFQCVSRGEECVEYERLAVPANSVTWWLSCSFPFFALILLWALAIERHSWVICVLVSHHRQLGASTGTGSDVEGMVVNETCAQKSDVVGQGMSGA